MTAPSAADPLEPRVGAEPWVSVEAVAAYLGVKKLSIYRWIEGRGLPARKIGRLWKLKLSQVDVWVQSTDHAAVLSPAIGAPPGSGRRVTGGQGGQDRRTILVIDSEAARREGVSDVLTNDGYRVLMACDGAEAIEHLGSSPPPDLIVFDLEMPTLAGSQFRQQQMLHRELAAVPVLAVTGASNANLDGISALLRKPLCLPLLAKMIEALLADRHSSERPGEEDGVVRPAIGAAH